MIPDIMIDVEVISTCNSRQNVCCGILKNFKYLPEGHIAASLLDAAAAAMGMKIKKCSILPPYYPG